MVLLIVLCLLLIVLSFLASSMEAALFSVTPLDVEKMCDRDLPGASRLRANKERIHDSIIAIVILNNIANIAGSILVGAMAAEFFSDSLLGVFSAVLTLLIIMFGEVLPKTIGERHAVSYARHTAVIVHALRFTLAPVIYLMRALTRSRGAEASADRTAEEEITLLARLGHADGIILESENQLIRQVFQLNDILARNIMTPRTVVFALQQDRTLDEVARELYGASVSRIPVFDEDLDSITGIVHIRDLLAALAKGQGARPLSDFADEPMFIPDNAQADMLLKSYQKNRTHIAVVIDEHGGMAGILTLEDILEQLVGEIVDEHDRDVDMRVKARTLMERRKRP